MKIILFIIVIFSFCCCEKVDCNKIVSAYKQQKLWIIVSEIEFEDSYHYFKVKGRNKYNLDTIYAEENRYYCGFKNYFNVGDTIVKNKGESIFYIHKKDTVLAFPFECDGKIYK